MESSVDPGVVKACKELNVSREVFDAMGPSTLTDDSMFVNGTFTSCIFSPPGQDLSTTATNFLLVAFMPDGPEYFRTVAAGAVRNGGGSSVAIGDEALWGGALGSDLALHLFALDGTAAITVTPIFTTIPAPERMTRERIVAVAEKLITLAP